MAKGTGAVVIDVQKCKGCALCVGACPTKTLALAKDINSKGFNYAEMGQDTCTGCAICAQMCPDAVITVYRMRKQPSAG
jgi:2-oxoglutarate ferredoxin oxidoreductase subunit delta